MKLFFREYGKGNPIIILHGLFGMSDNWMTMAKRLSDYSHRVIVPDLRNHGQSPHAEAWDYETMAKDMKLPESVVIADDIRETGNTSAASIPLAMDSLLKTHPELHGGLALIIGYGAGLVYAGQVIKLPPKPAATSK